MANKLVEIIVQVRDEASGAFDRLKSAIGRVGDSVLSVKGLILGLVSGAVIRGVESLVGAFEEQEKATTKLNAALRVSGRFTQEASDAIQKMADDMRETTTHSDEEALAVSAQFASLARELTTTQLAEAQKIAIGLADATGRSVEGASMLIVRSLTGQGNALKRYGVDLDTSASQQEKFNAIAAKLGPLFTISVESAKTLAGSIAQAKNEFNELKETLGTVIVHSFGLTEATHGLRDQFKAWNQSIKDHITTWIYWGKIVADVFRIIYASLTAAVALAYNTGKGFGAAFSLGIDEVVLAVESFINDKIIGTINAAFTQLDVLAHKFGKSFKFRLDTIETDSVNDQIKIDLNTFQEAAEGVGHALQGVRDAYGNLVKDVAAHPVKPPSLNKAGAGVNVGTVSDESAPERLRAATEAQKLLEAEYKVGIKTFAEYQAGLLRIRDELNMMRGASSLSRQEVIQLYEALAKIKEATTLGPLLAEQARLEAAYKAGTISVGEYHAGLAAVYDRMVVLRNTQRMTVEETTKLNEALAKIKDVKITALLEQADRLAADFKQGRVGVKEYDAALKDLIAQMEKLLKAAGLTDEQIKKITASMHGAKESFKGIGGQLEQAFGLGEGQGGEALAKANAQIAQMAYGLGTAFADAVGQSLAAGASFGKVVKAAVGEAAASFAKMSVGRALMEVAEGIAASLIPGKQAEAGAHFAAAKVFGAAAVFMGGIAGATGGFGGAASGGNAATQAAAGSAAKGSASIYIEGGILDMGDPRQAEALRKAIEELTDRDVFLK